MENVKLKAIKPGSVIKIDIGSGFYQRVQQLLFSLEKQDPEKALKTVAALKEREPVDEYENNFLTVLTLIYEIEKSAEEQGFIIENEYQLNKN